MNRLFVADTEPVRVENDFDSDEDIDDDDNWDEMEEEQEPTKCLFCNEVNSSIEKAIEHLLHQHHISLSDMKRKFNLEQYSYIKVSNTIPMILNMSNGPRWARKIY